MFPRRERRWINRHSLGGNVFDSSVGKKYKGLWFTGIGSLGIMLCTCINLQSRMAQAKAEMETELAGNPLRGLADVALQSIQL
jgi:hypothetical protein